DRVVAAEPADDVLPRRAVEVVGPRGADDRAGVARGRRGTRPAERQSGRPDGARQKDSKAEAPQGRLIVLETAIGLRSRETWCPSPLRETAGDARRGHR